MALAKGVVPEHVWVCVGVWACVTVTVAVPMRGRAREGGATCGDKCGREWVAYLSLNSLSRASCTGSRMWKKGSPNSSSVFRSAGVICGASPVARLCVSQHCQHTNTLCVYVCVCRSSC